MQGGVLMYKTALLGLTYIRGAYTSRNYDSPRDKPSVAVLCQLLGRAYLLKAPPGVLCKRRGILYFAGGLSGIIGRRC
jgi:hypothetical protein